MLYKEPKQKCGAKHIGPKKDTERHTQSFLPMVTVNDPGIHYTQTFIKSTTVTKVYCSGCLETKEL